jgi:hypothetical protein
MAELRRHRPESILFGCSTAGEIVNDAVADDTLVATAVQFDHTRLAAHSVELTPGRSSLEAGIDLAREIDPVDLSHVLVLSDGLSVNGSELVKGLTQTLPETVVLTGGLAGDGDRFSETVVVLNDRISRGPVTALAFHGDRLRIGYGSLGGWDQFGVERRVTRSSGNILYEIDGRSALELYKEYLGKHAAQLPASGLLFPLAIRAGREDRTIVRTILGVDEATQSLTFAGDIPQGWYAQLMRANFDRLVDGAHGAAKTSMEPLAGAQPDLALLISCVGRKLILKQRVEEEIEAVREVVGPKAMMTGFYSYGEIAPFRPGTPCELHNQTMTITAFREI